MTEAKTAHIFLDTNTALHFQRPDQIDWCELAGCNQAILVGAPILHRELEKEKVHNPSGKLRKRAGAYTKWLAEFVFDPAREVRSGTTWHFIPNEPQIDFREHSLSAEIADDHFIASVLSYRPPEDAKVYVVTADTGMHIKLRYRQIAALRLPDSTKLPDEPDAQEKELQELRRKVAQKHIPSLKLITTSADGRHPLKLRSQVMAPSVIPLEEMKRRHPPLEASESLTPNNRAALTADIRYQVMCAEMCGTLLTPERAQEYNKESEAFLIKYNEYHSKLLHWEEQAALTVELELTLSNKGTAPATNIDIILRFPEDIILFEAGDFPKRPKEPRPPDRPSCAVFPDMRQFLLGGPDYSGLLQTPYPTLSHVKANSAARVDLEDHHIHYWPRNLKHGFTEELEKIYFRFPSRQSVRQFHAEYEISSAELPEPITGRIHFVIV